MLQQGPATKMKAGLWGYEDFLARPSARKFHRDLRRPQSQTMRASVFCEGSHLETCRPHRRGKAFYKGPQVTGVFNGLCHTILRCSSAVRYSTILYSTLQYYTIPYYTIPCYIAVYQIILHYIIPYCTIFILHFPRQPGEGPQNDGLRRFCFLGVELLRAWTFQYLHTYMYMGGCQNYGPLLGPPNTRCRIILRALTGSIVLTTTHMYMYICIYIYTYIMYVHVP